MPQVECEAVAVRALREHLLRVLPATCAAVNLTRAAVLKAPRAGSYTVPVGATLRLGIEPGAAAISLTAGTRTAAQVAADLVALDGLTASADDDGRLVVTADTTPTEGTHSGVYLESDTTGGNEAFGWDAGGEFELRSAMVAPTHRGVMDGWPLAFPGGVGQVLVLLADRASQPRSNHRDDVYQVTLDVAVVRADPHGNVRRSREHIQAAVRCVREAILADRQLGFTSPGNAGQSIVGVYEQSCSVDAMPFQWEGHPLMDRAEMRWRIDVHEIFP